MNTTEVREWLAAWWPEIAVAVLVVVLALPMFTVSSLYGIGAGDILAVGLIGASAITFRRAPGTALGLAWAALLVHILGLVIGLGGYPQFAEIVIAITAFGTARYGSRNVLVLSGLSILGVLGVSLVASTLVGYGLAPSLIGPYPLWDLGVRTLSITIALMALLGIPWLLGLVGRSQATAADSEQVAVDARTGEQQARIGREQAEVERGQAQEIAHLRARQTRMAREVHDVVGHSLAVILAQAESAQFLPEAHTDEHRRVLANVASTARQSLQDVRAVLGATQDDGQPVAVQSAGGMDSLVDGVRNAGYDVGSSVVGIPRPLPPERDAVAFRVLQEMLTNALKHGARGTPIAVERHWDQDLRIEVRNYCADPGLTQPVNPEGDDHFAPPAFDGTGVDGMQRRLESVGGRLDVRRRPAVDGSGPQTFTATAWLPLES